MITLESLNIDAICEYFDGEVNRLANYIDAVYNNRSIYVVYEVKNKYDLALFDLVKKKEVISSINECLDGIEVIDYEIETGYIRFRIE